MALAAYFVLYAAALYAMVRFGQFEAEAGESLGILASASGFHWPHGY
jgi:hypothetical protein